ncbi:cation:proton antiporter [Leptospira kanakyensis]|uniref:Cation/H(+) antiporter n=1 Tax=Leptospira kanakyensis TaxID=2484968 RepID=A0A6N4Q9G3_9LEPT|nr:cation:proton antiporter [Leptospira kanakyensis]MCW7468792.1 cation:proton antiporter [Leptospira kanakyensis]TGK50016.1 cation/H(+) antiporter [Leptospira kanakyensis]TGK58467.1 cation/H(+) antiporter [Leptospira kanakyensis]TGK69154.1 cation/H(+) antiporter [Leptospira kanakyensis]
MKSSLFYALAVAVFFSALAFVFYLGQLYFPLNHGLNPLSLELNFSSFLVGFVAHLKSPFGRLLLQILLILVTCKIFSFLFSLIRIPSVIGEITGGLVLGPSLLGMLAPEFSEMIFPASSMGSLKLLSQVGLIFFMFLIGLETDWKNLHGSLHTAVVISHVSIMFPFLLGVISSLFLFETLAPEKVSFLSFSLFLGISMSITAFPVLARIIQEKKLNTERSGVLAITCAAADDVTAWLILALILGLTSSDSMSGVLLCFLGVVLFLYLAFKYVRTRFASSLSKLENIDFLPNYIVFFLFIWLTFSSLFTESMGIHSLFGAFIAGSTIPANHKIRKIIINKFQDVSVIFLLPLFFAYSGLKTQIGLLSDPNLFLICLLILFVAIFGKLGGSTISARFLGESWKDSLIIGILMNTRGLMELIVLNIGLEMGIIGPELFTIMVIMALVTTAMSGPAINLVQKLFKKKSSPDIVPVLENSGQSVHPKILIAFARPKTGIDLVKLCYKIFPNANFRTFHVNQNYNFDIEQSQYEMSILFENIRFISANEGIPVDFQFSSSENFETALWEQLDEYKPDLLILGSPNVESWKEINKGPIKKIIKSSNCSVAVFVNKGLESLNKIFMESDSEVAVSIINSLGGDPSLFKQWQDGDHFDPNHHVFVRDWNTEKDFEFLKKNYLILGKKRS